jgi:LacI family transcriptional regulator
MARSADPTLADVAEAAGVDVSTVSRVLNGQVRHRVSDSTRERVIEAARRLAYRPNALARGLRTSRTYTLGIALPDAAHPELDGIVGGAARAAAEQGYAMVLAQAEPTRRASEVVVPRRARLDGLLIATAEDEAAPAASRHVDGGAPCVVLNRRSRGVAHAVSFDDEAAARMATEHLLELGHRRIALLAGRPGGWRASRRLAGFAAALGQAGLASDPRLVAATASDVGSGESAMRTLLARRPHPTAVVAASSALAAGALRALRAAGLAVPADVSVVGVHDGAVADLLSPALTTVRLPSRELGAGAARGLIDLLEGRVERVALSLPPERIVVRESSAPPRAVAPVAAAAPAGSPG